MIRVLNKIFSCLNQRKLLLILVDIQLQREVLEQGCKQLIFESISPWHSLLKAFFSLLKFFARVKVLKINDVGNHLVSSIQGFILDFSHILILQSHFLYFLKQLIERNIKLLNVLENLLSWFLVLNQEHEVKN